MTEKHLLRGVLIFVLVLLGISFMFPHKPALLNRSEFSFATSSDSRLHFNNVRSYWYKREEIKGQGADKYNYTKWDESMPKSIRPLIIHQWRVNQATLFLVPHSLDSAQGSLQLILHTDTLSVGMDALDRDGHIDIADRWFRHLDTAQAYQLCDEKGQSIAVTQTETKAVKAVLTDYFTLVNYLK